MDNKRKHTAIENDDDENYIPKKLKSLVVEEILHDNDDGSRDSVISDPVTVINEYVASYVELATDHSERPVAPFDDFEYHEVDAFDYVGVVAHMSGNPDDGTLSGHLSNNESVVNMNIYYDLETLDLNFSRDFFDEVEEDELIYALNVVDEHAGHLENVIAWNCDPTFSYAYRWNSEENVIRNDDISIIIIDLIGNDDTITTTSSSEWSTVITSFSKRVEYIFNINVDDTDSDDSSSTGTIRSGIG